MTILVTGRPTMRLGPRSPEGHRLAVRLQYSAVLRGRTATLTLTRLTVRCSRNGCRTTGGKPVTQGLVLRHRTLQVPLPAPGHGIRLQLSTAAFQLADAPWAAAHASNRYIR